MSLSLDFPLTAGGPVAAEVVRRGFTGFLLLLDHVRALPYGRPADAQDVLSVLKERVGTCSSKHRLLATVAHECGRSEIELIVGIYEMSEENTPGVGAVLERAGLVSIPEAHCYLRMGARRYDFTGLECGSASFFDALLSEHVVAPEDLPGLKVRLHWEAMSAWCETRSIAPAYGWSVREACIAALSSAGADVPSLTVP